LKYLGLDAELLPAHQGFAGKLQEDTFVDGFLSRHLPVRAMAFLSQAVGALALVYIGSPRSNLAKRRTWMFSLRIAIMEVICCWTVISWFLMKGCSSKTTSE